MTQKGFAPILIILLLLLIIASLIGWNYYLSPTKKIPNSSQITPTNKENVSQSKERIAFIEDNKINSENVGSLIIEELDHIGDKKIIYNQVNFIYIFGWSFDNKYIAFKAQDINQQTSNDEYYGVLNVDSGQINKLPIRDVLEGADDIAGWTSENNLLYHNYLQSSYSGNQDFIVYSPKGEELKKFTLVTPKSKDNNAYFYNHITPDGNWLVYQAGNSGLDDGIEVLDNKQYSFNLRSYKLEDATNSASQTQTSFQVLTKDKKVIILIKSKNDSRYGYVEYPPPNNTPLGKYSYDIYKYDGDTLEDKPEVTISYNREYITQHLDIHSISPDGQYVEYTEADEDTRYTSRALYVMNLKTNQETLISDKASKLEWSNQIPH